MEDLVVPEIDHFNKQANLHYQIQNSLHEVVSSFEVHHDTIFNQLDSSQAEHYLAWWQQFKSHILKQADLHGQLGKNLLTAGDNYHTTDKNIEKSM